jgi:hypothetical protein
VKRSGRKSGWPKATRRVSWKAVIRASWKAVRKALWNQLRRWLREVLKALALGDVFRA